MWCICCILGNLKWSLHTLQYTFVAEQTALSSADRPHTIIPNSSGHNDAACPQCKVFFSRSATKISTYQIQCTPLHMQLKELWISVSLKVFGGGCTSTSLDSICGSLSHHARPGCFCVCFSRVRTGSTQSVRMISFQHQMMSSKI